VLLDDAGTGETVLARASANELGRDVIAPDPADLEGDTITELDRALAGSPSVVILDEAEDPLRDAAWRTHGDGEAQRALLAALDGSARSDEGPLTIAPTIDGRHALVDPAVWPGRPSPVLLLAPPTWPERREILARAVRELPGADTLDVDAAAQRTAGRSGAELVGLPVEAMSGSLIDPPMALRSSVVASIVAERFTIGDEHREPDVVAETLAVHEAGHAAIAYLLYGQGAVASIGLGERPGLTVLAELRRVRRDRARLRARVTIALTGPVAEQLAWSVDGITGGRAGRPGKRHGMARGGANGRPSHGRGRTELTRPALARASTAARSGDRARGASTPREVRARLRPEAARLAAIGDGLVASAEHTLTGVELDALPARQARTPPR